MCLPERCRQAAQTTKRPVVAEGWGSRDRTEEKAFQLYFTTLSHFKIWAQESLSMKGINSIWHELGTIYYQNRYNFWNVTIMFTEENVTQWDYKATLFFIRTAPANAISCFPARGEILNKSHNFHHISSLLLAHKIFPRHCWSYNFLVLVMKCLACNNIKPPDARLLPPLIQTCDEKGNPA